MPTQVSDDSAGTIFSGTPLFLMISFHPAHMFINSPLLNSLNFNYSVPLFPAGTLASFTDREWCAMPSGDLVMLVDTE